MSPLLLPAEEDMAAGEPCGRRGKQVEPPNAVAKLCFTGLQVTKDHVSAICAPGGNRTHDQENLMAWMLDVVVGYQKPCISAEFLPFLKAVRCR